MPYSHTQALALACPLSLSLSLCCVFQCVRLVLSATLFIFHIQCVSCVLRKLRIHIESPSGHILKLRPVQNSSTSRTFRYPLLHTHNHNTHTHRHTKHIPYLVAESLSLCTTLFNVISISASSHPKNSTPHSFHSTQHSFSPSHASYSYSYVYICHTTAVRYHLDFDQIFATTRTYTLTYIYIYI